MDAREILDGVRLLPVVVVDDAALAPDLARTLLDAGIGAIEVTLRTEEAMEAIARISREVPGMLVGAGSIRRPAQFAEVRDAGARFAVSPGSTDRLAAAADMPWVAGAATASECLALLESGHVLQKFFPAEQNGGAKALRALSAPLPEVRFCPTGGVSPSNVADYLAVDSVLCVGGSWFVPGDAIAARDFDRVRELSVAALELVGG